MRRRRHAPPGFPGRGCRDVVRAPRWYRPAPSGLNGAAHRAGARRPAAAVDPGDLWRATGPAKRAGPGAAPVSSGALPPGTRPATWPALHRHPERRHTGTRQPPLDTSGHLFDYVNRQKNYKADRRSAAKLSLNQSRGAPASPASGSASAATSTSTPASGNSSSSPPTPPPPPRPPTTNPRNQPTATSAAATQRRARDAGFRPTERCLQPGFPCSP